MYPCTVALQVRARDRVRAALTDNGGFRNADDEVIRQVLLGHLLGSVRVTIICFIYSK